MFDVAPTELLLVAVVALVVIGPKDLPKAMRVVGYWIGRARGLARHFRSGLDAMIREAELEEMEKRWAEENARIMREHPMTPPPPADPDAPLAITHGPDVYAPPQAVHAPEAEQGGLPAAPVLPGAPPETPADAPAPAPDAAGTPRRELP